MQIQLALPRGRSQEVSIYAPRKNPAKWTEVSIIRRVKIRQKWTAYRVGVDAEWLLTESHVYFPFVGLGSMVIIIPTL